MGLEFRRRLHRYQRQKLEQMVRHHIAKRAGRVVEAAAMADVELFIDRDLHMVDVVAIPDRLEHAIGEPQHQNVLDRFLAEVVIDPVDLLLIGDLEQFVVERLGRSEARAERLFDHKTPPRTVFLQHAGAAELLGDRREGGRRRRQVEQTIAAGLALGLQFVQLLGHCIERGWIARIGFDAGNAFEQTFGDRLIDRTGLVLAQAFQQAFAHVVIRHSLAGDADDAEFFRQQIGRREIVQRGQHQPVGEVAGGAEDDERAGIGFRFFEDGSVTNAAPCGRQILRASRREFFPRTYVPCASENAQTAPRSALRPAPPRRWRR